MEPEPQELTPPSLSSSTPSAARRRNSSPPVDPELDLLHQATLGEHPFRFPEKSESFMLCTVASMSDQAYFRHGRVCPCSVVPYLHPRCPLSSLQSAPGTRTRSSTPAPSAAHAPSTSKTCRAPANLRPPSCFCNRKVWTLCSDSVYTDVIRLLSSDPDPITTTEPAQWLRPCFHPGSAKVQFPGRALHLPFFLFLFS